ncbi:MAG TPA: hypothetical protein VNB22_06320 [Pyrinomonadaceae bacterium]|jgi:hypothetical protein|nr:hypothetical protein [Pyrinomonadaceae bacterium]
MKKILFFLALSLFACASIVSAQPRPVDKTQTPTAPVKPAPASFVAKYEGGMFGFSKKQEGTLKFEDANSRLVFFDKTQKEVFSIPYKSMLVVSPQSQSVQSTTGKVVSMIPYGGIVGGFIKEKRRYLIISFDDPDVEAKGVTSFKIDDPILLDSVVAALGTKAELKQRGDAYIRPKVVKVDADSDK